MRLSDIELQWITNYSRSTLDLSGHNLGVGVDVDNIAKLYDALKNNEHVKCLILSHNSLENDCIPWLLKLKQVESLVLDYNNLTDDCLKELAESHLKRLDVSYNNISDKGVDLLIKHGHQDSIHADSMRVSLSKRQELYGSIKRRKNGGSPALSNTGILNYCFNAIRQCSCGWLFSLTKENESRVVEKKQPKLK